MQSLYSNGFETIYDEMYQTFIDYKGSSLNALLFVYLDYEYRGDERGNFYAFTRGKRIDFKGTIKAATKFNSYCKKSRSKTFSIE